MRECVRIDVAAAVWLLATVDAAIKRFPNRIVGIDPKSSDAHAMLVALRFHQLLKFTEPPEVEAGREAIRHIMEIETRSGGTEFDSGERMPEAGIAISEILPDCGFDSETLARVKDQIHRAMNEALLNVSNHAYRSTNEDAAQTELPLDEQRWWAVGIVDKVKRTFDLVVVDRGVGIPRTLRRTVLEFARGLFSGEAFSDGERVRAAMEYGRSSVGKGVNRGKGMPQMLDLLKRFPGSMLLVESLKGIYVSRHDGTTLEQDHSDNSNGLPGTLVHWHLELAPSELE